MSGRIGECKHVNNVKTVTAGLERTVCEGCGHVSVTFIEPTVRLFPDAADSSKAASEGWRSILRKQSARGCDVCKAPSQYLIPTGVACEEHAWKEASLQQIIGSEPWIPIRIDQRTRTR